jgi:hypothetical protein
MKIEAHSRIATPLSPQAGLYGRQGLPPAGTRAEPLGIP